MQTGSFRRCYHKSRSPDKTVTVHYRQEEVIPETTVFFTVSLSTFVAIYHSRCCSIEGRWPKRCISDCGFHWSKFIASGLIGGTSVHYFFFLITYGVFWPGIKIKTGKCFWKGYVFRSKSHNPDHGSCFGVLTLKQGMLFDHLVCYKQRVFLDRKPWAGCKRWRWTWGDDLHVCYKHFFF